MNQAEVGVVIPTFQASKHLSKCLTPLLQSPLKPRILIIDSSSTDGTVEMALKMGVETLVIHRNEFNHGLTREKGRQILKTPLIVMMTQDAYPSSPSMLEQLIKPILEKKASVSYARQMAHIGASIYASFSRHFNYPSESHQRSLKDIPLYGSYTFFCSNSCAAYLNSALDEIDGFSSVLFGEDSLAVAKLLQRQHTIAYVAEAVVYHSHDYTLKQEFLRHFEMGLARQMAKEHFSLGGSVHPRGKTYIKCLLQELWYRSPLSIPYALCQIFSKWSGYYLGKHSLHASLWFKEKLSSQKHYWDSSTKH